jgi:hypothetical protein
MIYTSLGLYKTHSSTTDFSLTLNVAGCAGVIQQQIKQFYEKGIQHFVTQWDACIIDYSESA